MSGAPLTRDEISDNRLVAPAVSVIVAALGKRPAWQHDQPLRVPRELYAAARDEMEAIMKKRGFRLPKSYFLVYGTVIVCNG